MTKFMVLQAASMSRLGGGEPELYGTATAAQLEDQIRGHAARHAYQVDIVYAHLEAEAIAHLYRAAGEGCAGVVMNPAGFMHAGFALRDCLRGLPIPVIEVHVSSTGGRGMGWATAEAAAGVIAGFGLQSYFLALEALLARSGR